jgi:hypothetical protein
VDKGYYLQLAASGAAVVVLVALAGWAQISKPLNPLNDARARTLLADEFPGRAIEALWVAEDGQGALAKSGGSALVLCRFGDGYVARQIPWALAVAASFKNGLLIINLDDIAAPRAVLALPSWPPKDLAA